MKAVSILPENYVEFYSIDLQKNKKIAFLVNFFAVVISVLMIVPVCFFIPLNILFETESGSSEYFIKLTVLIGLMVVYMILHELVHGIAMKICGTKKVKYGVKGLYAFAGSEDYYYKKSYIFIALAPVVFWGVVLGIISCFVPKEWFWIVYFIQVMNISGATGDFFVSLKFSRFPKNILIKDYGVGMKVFSDVNAK